MNFLRYLYWFFAGACIGFGLIGILTIGLPFIILGCGLIIYGILRIRLHEMWLAIVGFGLIPALILATNIASYFTMSITFTCIALFGTTWPLLRHRLTRASPKNLTT